MDKVRRPRWRDEDKDQRCDQCVQPLDNCTCVCPFCGKTTACECVIGPDVPMGG